MSFAYSIFPGFILEKLKRGIQLQNKHKSYPRRNNTTDVTIPGQSTFKHPLKVKAKLNSKSFRVPYTRLLLGLYDYRFKHLAIMEQKDYDVITTLQIDGLAQLFG